MMKEHNYDHGLSSIVLWSVNAPTIYGTTELRKSINYFYNDKINYVNNSFFYDDNNQSDIIGDNHQLINTTASDLDEVYNSHNSNNINERENVYNYWALLAIILVVGTAAGNILVCLAITWEKRLQNVTNYFLMSLAITDLMVAILVMPLGILTLFRGEFLHQIIFLLQILNFKSNIQN